MESTTAVWLPFVDSYRTFLTAAGMECMSFLSTGA